MEYNSSNGRTTDVTLSLKLPMPYLRLARADNHSNSLMYGKSSLPQSNPVTKTKLPALGVNFLTTKVWEILQLTHTLMFSALISSQLSCLGNTQTSRSPRNCQIFCGLSAVQGAQVRFDMEKKAKQKTKFPFPLRT